HPPSHSAPPFLAHLHAPTFPFTFSSLVFPTTPLQQPFAPSNHSHPPPHQNQLDTSPFPSPPPLFFFPPFSPTPPQKTKKPTPPPPPP
ncbi:hypothetical protein, partial [Enterococcus faecium]